MKSVYEKLVLKHGFSPAQKKIISLIKNAQVLEIGASSGYMTKEFMKGDNIVDCIEVNNEAAKSLQKFASKIIVGSIEEFSVQKQIFKKYDFIICADVLEHLVNPDKALAFLKTKLKIGGSILISIPNIACWNMRMMLFKGKFNYEDSGILDKTHLRFFTYNSFLKLLKDCGLRISNIFPTETKMPFEGSVKKLPVLGKIIVGMIKPLLVRLYPNLIIEHYVVEAKNG